jgi:hypothetical protein
MTESLANQALKLREFDFKIIKGNLIKEEDDWEENYTRLLMVGDLFPRQKIPWGC